MVKNISLLLLALWLGAAIFFSAVVAPAAFSVLRGFQLGNAGEIAGAIVSRSLGVINVWGFLTGVGLLLLTLYSRRSYKRDLFLLESALLGIVIIMTGVGHWLIAPRIRALRSGLNLPIGQFVLDDARRVAFNSMHRYSVSALSIAMIAALIACLLLTRNSRTN
jgi:hypothetical protein